jgi:hypothetical protein
MKAEVIWTREVAVLAVSHRSYHSTDEYNDPVYKNDEGTRWQQLAASLMPLNCSSHKFSSLYRSNEKSFTWKYVYVGTP